MTKIPPQNTTSEVLLEEREHAMERSQFKTVRRKIGERCVRGLCKPKVAGKPNSVQLKTKYLFVLVIGKQFVPLSKIVVFES